MATASKLNKIPVDKGSISWASVLGRSVTASLDENILEVVLGKESRGGFSVSDNDCLNLLRRLGIDTRPGSQLEEVQICPNGRGIIFLTFKKNIEIARFCRHDVLDVTSTGTTIANIQISENNVPTSFQKLQDLNY